MLNDLYTYKENSYNYFFLICLYPFVSKNKIYPLLFSISHTTYQLNLNKPNDVAIYGSIKYNEN